MAALGWGHGDCVSGVENGAPRGASARASSPRDGKTVHTQLSFHNKKI